MSKYIQGLGTIDRLSLPRCPRCGVDTPNLGKQWEGATRAHRGHQERHWVLYSCLRCGGMVLAASTAANASPTEVIPEKGSVSSVIPDPARSYLQQALDSIAAPAGAVMLAASAVDAMLKAKGYKTGSLYARIEEAAKQHLITNGMAQWAHQVRLDANDQRHADEAAPLPTTDDAQRSIHFVEALGHFLFVVPEMVNRGLNESGANTVPTSPGAGDGGGQLPSGR